MGIVDGDGYGNGNGYGDGDGDGNGNGNGDGYGYGNGNGDGYGYGNGNGDGYGYGNGDGNGNGNGYGNGYGNGNGSGNGSGDGYGNGNGNGYGYGSGNGNCEVEPDTPILAWHFVFQDGRLRYKHNGKEVMVKPGLVLTHDGEPELCHTGLHASFKVEDARSYHDGMLCRVACSGRVKFGKDKLVCTRREVLAVYPDGQPPKEG